MAFLRFVARVVLVAALSSGGPLAAQEPAAPAPASPGREGFLIGFSLGFGSAHPCDVCANFGGDFHVGAFAKKNLAVLGEIGAVGSDDEGEGLLLAAIAVQYWPRERFWLKGGIGIGDSLANEFDRPDERKWGAMAAAGYEVTRKGRFAFDVQARGAVAGDRRSVGLNLGFHWY
jgi:hypothetical protein